MKARQIDITKEDVRCCDELLISGDHINAIYDLWLDVDKYFGTNTRGNDDTYVNFYTDWYIDGTIKASYEVHDEYGTKSFDWELTKEETEFFRQKMEEYCRQCDGISLIELWNEYNDESEVD